MPTQSLLIGPVFTLNPNVVFALPARAVHFIASESCQFAYDVAFASTAGSLAANTPLIIIAPFVRYSTATSVTAPAIGILKAV